MAEEVSLILLKAADRAIFRVATVQQRLNVESRQIGEMRADLITDGRDDRGCVVVRP